MGQSADQSKLLKRCEGWLASAVEKPEAAALVRAIKAGGCNALSGGIRCVLCGPKGQPFDNVQAYYRASTGRVVLCADRLTSEAQTTASLIHELVHAYDHCRRGLRIPYVGTTVPWALDCATEACSEVRAYSLANFADVPRWAGKRDLVYRGALASMLNNKASDCGGAERCAHVLSLMIDLCLADAVPFSPEGQLAERSGRYPKMDLPQLPPALPPPSGLVGQLSRAWRPPGSVH